MSLVVRHLSTFLPFVSTLVKKKASPRPASQIHVDEAVLIGAILVSVYVVGHGR